MLTSRIPKKPVRSISVVIGSDHDLARAALRAVLCAERDIEVRAATHLSKLTDVVGEYKPTVALLHIPVPDDSVMRLPATIRADAPQTRTVLLTYSEEQCSVRSFLQSGGLGYVLTRGSVRELMTALRAAANGRSFVDPRLRDALLHTLLKASDEPVSQAGSGALSERELEVLLGVARGYTHREIANSLGVSTKTVETYRSRIAEKLNLHSRHEIVEFALATELLLPAKPPASVRVLSGKTERGIKTKLGSPTD